MLPHLRITLLRDFHKIARFVTQRIQVGMPRVLKPTMQIIFPFTPANTKVNGTLAQTATRLQAITASFPASIAMSTTMPPISQTSTTT